MGKIIYKDNNISNFDNHLTPEKINLIITDKDTKELQIILKKLSAKYDISAETLTKITRDLKNIQIPVSIYSDEKLSMLESTVKYLKEDLNLKFSQIGNILKRDERTIWVTYHNSLRKSNKKTAIFDAISIPIEVLSDRKFSILEQAIGFLKEEHRLKFSEIARILKLDDRTVWTCYSRLKKKREGENEAG